MIVTLEEVKAHLRIQHKEEDEYLLGLIIQAQAAAEAFCYASLEKDAPEQARLAVLLMVSFYYENRDVPDMTTFKAMRMAFENLLYPCRDVSRMF